MSSYCLIFIGAGIVVDDAIVVIENTHRIFDNGKVPIKKAAKMAAGEVFLLVLSGTLCISGTLFHWRFWKDLPVNSCLAFPSPWSPRYFFLFVAYIINPVFAVDFMGHRDDEDHSKIDQGFWITLIFSPLSCFYLNSDTNLLSQSDILFIGFYFNKFFIIQGDQRFPDQCLAPNTKWYASLLRFVLKGKRPIWLLTVFYFIADFSLFAAVKFIQE